MRRRACERRGFARAGDVPFSVLLYNRGCDLVALLFSSRANYHHTLSFTRAVCDAATKASAKSSIVASCLEVLQLHTDVTQYVLTMLLFATSAYERLDSPAAMTRNRSTPLGSQSASVSSATSKAMRVRLSLFTRHYSTTYSESGTGLVLFGTR